jgi:type II secretory pathway pseudopilin PulG
MDFLAVFVVIAIAAQACLPLIAYIKRKSILKAKAKQANLIESAADRQLDGGIRCPNSTSE